MEIFHSSRQNPPALQATVTVVILPDFSRLTTAATHAWLQNIPRKRQWRLPVKFSQTYINSGECIRLRVVSYFEEPAKYMYQRETTRGERRVARPHVSRALVRGDCLSFASLEATQSKNVSDMLSFFLKHHFFFYFIRDRCLRRKPFRILCEVSRGDQQIIEIREKETCHC